jgi:Tfp pilus assembly protein PilN
MRSSLSPPSASPSSAPQAEDLPVMAEVDLLPPWYPVLLKRRRRLLVQSWLTGLVVVALMAVLVWRQANEEATHVELASLEEQRRMTDAMLLQLEAEESRLDGLLGRAELVSRMGLPLEVSRVLAQIDAAMPADIALTALDVTMEERTGPAQGAIARSPGVRGGAQKNMKFTFTGFAASPDSVIALSRSLQQQPLLRDVAPAGTQSTEVYGRLIVAFEISFRVDLSPGGGALAQAKGGA